jgi:hypothetical protein
LVLLHAISDELGSSDSSVCVEGGKGREVSNQKSPQEGKKKRHL